MSQHIGNARQMVVIAMMRANQARELYEGAAANGRDGSGVFWVTHTGDEPHYAPLNWAEVRDLEKRGLIKEKWPGCYELAAASLPRPEPGEAT